MALACLCTALRAKGDALLSHGEIVILPWMFGGATGVKVPPAFNLVVSTID